MNTYLEKIWTTNFRELDNWDKGMAIITFPACYVFVIYILYVLHREMGEF